MVNKPVVIDNRAEGEVLSAYEWYLHESKSAASRFLEEMRQATGTIGERPLSFPMFVRPNRRMRLASFPYYVVFREQLNQIIILAVVHCSRGPRFWKRRLR